MSPFPKKSAQQEGSVLAIHHAEHGFTLIEMLVVLAIMSLAAVLFVGAANNDDRGASRMALAELESEISSAREMAMVSGVAQNVSFETRQFAPELGNSKNLIFYPDGSSNGGSVFENDRLVMRIRWLDGRTSK